MRHILLRLAPRLDGRWLVVLVLVGLGIAGASFIRWAQPEAELELLVLGPDGQFHEELVLPPEWVDSTTSTPGAVVRFRLILGARNVGYSEAWSERLILSLPARYQLLDGRGEQLPTRRDLASPLVQYLLEPRLDPLEPGRLPQLLPAHETLWVEAIVPRYYCVELADSIPEFVAATPPSAEAMSELRILYSFEGGDLQERQTGTVSVHLDPGMLAVSMPPTPPSFPMEIDPTLARPDLGPLRHVSTQEVLCGEPEAPMEMRSVVWENEEGARLIVLEYGGAARKYLFDLNGDGIVDRESWDPEGTGRFIATRRVQLPIPDFLLPPVPAARYDLARFDEIPPDSLARLDPFAEAMEGPGPMPQLGATTEEPTVAPTAPQPQPEPAPTAPQPLGRPVPIDPGSSP
jgi:hypothetical protein